jgi:anti-anti-sigma regulatory factor
VADDFGAHWWDHAGAVVVDVRGTLDTASSGSLRDALAKAAADAPRAVIVDLDGLVVGNQVALAMFPTVASKIAVWPGIPLILLAADDATHHILAEYRMRRYVPVCRSLQAAEAAIGQPPPRRVERIELPYGSGGVHLARDFVTEWCQRWQVANTRTADALRITAALVDNTLKHTQGPPTVRIELRRGMLTVAVYDANPQPAHPIESDTDPTTSIEHGLTMIARRCRAWGSNPTHTDGKVVWAVL